MNVSSDTIANRTQTRIAIARRQGEIRTAEWDSYLRLMTNDWSEGLQMKLAPNIVHSTVRQIVATLVYDDPQFYARAMKARFSDRAEGVTAYMNYLWDQVNGSEQTELVVTDAIVYPFGMFKLGMGRAYLSEKAIELLEQADVEASLEQEMWNMGEFGYTPVVEEQRHATHIPRHEQYLNDPVTKESPNYEQIKAAVYDHIDQHGVFLVTVDTTRSADDEAEDPDMPFLYRISGRDVFFGGGGMIFEDARYALVRSKRIYDDWLHDKAYEHPENVGPTSTIDEMQYLNSGEMEEDKEGRGLATIDLWEEYDKTEGTFSTWVEGTKEPLRGPMPMPYRFMKGYPLEMLRLNILPEHLYGPSMLQYLDHPQRMDSDIAHRIGMHVKNSSVKWILLTDRLKNPENADKTAKDLSNPDMDAVIEALSPDVLTSLPPSQIDPAFFQLRAIMKEAVQEAVGLNDPARGNITGATATEVRTASSATTIVLGDTARKVRRSIRNIMMKLMAIVREFGPEYMVVPVIGTKNDWKDFSRDDLVGNWQIKVELPLPGDKQNDLNNSINALHEMRGSPNVKGEGEKRLEKVVLKHLGFEPELFMTEPSMDTIKAVELEHKVMLMLHPVPPIEPMLGEDSAYHMEQHERLFADLERQMGQMTMMGEQQQQAAQQEVQASQQAAQQQIQQIAQTQGPDVANQVAPQVMEQASQPSPQTAMLLQFAQQMLQQIQGQMQQIGTHMEQTQLLQPNVPRGRRPSALVFPDGNPGTAESIASNEIQGT